MEQERKKLPFKRDSGNHVPIKQTKTVMNNKRVEAIVNMAPSQTDPQGSYTGNPLNEDERPVQDQDDL